LSGLLLLGLYQVTACGTGAQSYDDPAASGGASTGGTAGYTTVADFPALHVEGNQIKNDAGDVIILRGVSTIDLGTTQQNEGGIIEMIDRITNRKDTQGTSPGFFPTVVRLAIYPADSDATHSPFTYEKGSSSFYTNLLRPTVNHLKQRGAYAIIDWHYIGDTDLHRDTTNDFWTTMAPLFANDKNVLFELFNEPVNKPNDWATVKADMQAWYDIVRKSAPNNLVLVGTPSWCQQLASTAQDPIDGYNIAYVGHIYPMHWTMTGVVSGAEAAAAVHPVFLTEWGFESGSNAVVDGTATSYGDPFKAWVDQLGVSWTAWCASNVWYSRMFETNTDPSATDSFKLLVGSGVMGGFAKDWLYEKRNDHSPFADR
jgi:hypothetical protein